MNISSKYSYDDLYQEGTIGLINTVNNVLSGDERTIIKMLYGIDCPKYKQREISQMLNIPQYKIFFLRAESFYNFSSEVDRLVKEDGYDRLYNLMVVVFMGVHMENHFYN